MKAVEPLLSSKAENKVVIGSGRNTSMHEYRRSRSTPRGKFFVLS